tara:strand:- start:2935 stop:3120 length:186 start_codon:yes stop_codon:yes gene_type:complete
MTHKRFTADIAIDIDPEHIDDFFNLVADAAETYSGILAQYRYYVQKEPNNELNGNNGLSIG